jgi:hypothetical protein
MWVPEILMWVPEILAGDFQKFWPVLPIVARSSGGGQV